MPKVKTNSGAKKRFRFTGTGKIKRHHAYHSHILTKKTKKQKRNLVHQAIVDKSKISKSRCFKSKKKENPQAYPRLFWCPQECMDRCQEYLGEGSDLCISRPS